MKTDLIAKLPLLRDYDAAEWLRFNRASEISRNVLSAHGYERIDTPIIELTELFLRKSGGELASQLYSFTDPGGYEVSLRPEFTAPVIRHVIEAGRLAGVPLRLEYSGPVFRYPTGDEFDNGMVGSFTQTGAELIGAGGPEADAEVISLALEGLAALGVPDARVALGHVGLVWDLLEQMHLSERARLFLINCVRVLSKGDRETVNRRASEIGLLSDRAAGGELPDRAEATAEQVEAVLGHSFGSSFRAALGQRSTEDVLLRLSEKVRTRDSAEVVRSAIDLLAQLSLVTDEPGEAITRGREVIRATGLSDREVGALDEIVAAAMKMEAVAGRIEVNLGLAREISYYTGAVFDLLSPDGYILGGGGRYDELVPALGGPQDTPAAGFAFNTDRVIARSETLKNGESQTGGSVRRRPL